VHARRRARHGRRGRLHRPGQGQARPDQPDLPGQASFIEKDEAAHKAVIDRRGKDQRGNGTALPSSRRSSPAEGSITRCRRAHDLNITGRPAQFGRGVMTDVGNKLLGQFADKLAAQLGEGDAQGDATARGRCGARSRHGRRRVEEVARSSEQAAGDGTR
jgi:hypothetical protein